MWKNVLFGVYMLVVVLQMGIRAGEVAVPNRIGNAKPGEWATYAFTKEISRKFIVVGFEEKDGVRHVTLKSQTLMNNVVLKEEETSRTVSDSNVLLKNIEAADVQQREEVIEIKGEKYTVTAISAKKNGLPITLYISDDFPVFGLVRMDMAGELLLQIHEWGFGDGD